MKMVLLPPFKVTQKQQEWLKKRKSHTGESISAILRSLIQKNIPEQ